MPRPPAHLYPPQLHHPAARQPQLLSAQTGLQIRRKLNYLHRNPVRAGLAEKPEDYVYSSYRNYVYGENWLIDIDQEWT